jgi:signal transduction histidine kinase
MEHALQPALALFTIALSVFSLITFFWLGLTVLLIGNRGSNVTWIGGVGLLLGAVFFLCHGALVGAGVPLGASPTDFWWHLAWIPGFAAPFFWAAVGVHYAGLTGAFQRLRQPVLLLVGALGGLTALLALVNWPVISHYGDFIRLLGNSLQFHGQAGSLPVAASPALPMLGIAFVFYVAVCACLPWASLIRRRLRPAAIKAESSGVHAPSALLWDAADAWSQARPALLIASICMMCAGGVAALIGVVAAFAAHNALPAAVSSGLPIGVPPSPPGHVPLVLVAADLCVQVSLAVLGLVIGWSVVRQGVLIERRLPQHGFFSHWRGTVAVASILAAVVAGMDAIEPDALPNLLVLVAVVTATYALFTRQSYGEHDRLLAQMRPFIASLTTGHAGWLSTDPGEVERNVEALFTSLCRDVLGASRGRLSLTAGRIHRTFTYTAPAEALADAATAREWVLPVSDERGVVARLALGPRTDGAGYTSADFEVASACGQRILDAVGEFTAAQAVASLARRRGLEAELSAALPRRVLHDDVLPRLHLAMLRLEALRSRVAVPALSGAPAEADSITSTDATPTAADTRVELGDVVRELGHAHHDLAALMRAAPAANPRRLEHGLAGALRSSLDGEFRGTFDILDWKVSPGATAAADTLPPIVADLLLGAALEATRNAGRYARGDDLHRKLTLRVALSADVSWVTVIVADDGVGLQNEVVRDERGTSRDGAALPDGFTPTPNAGGTRSGLLTHGALIALVGGSLTVKSQPGAGTAVTVRVPRASSHSAS